MPKNNRPLQAGDLIVWYEESQMVGFGDGHGRVLFRDGDDDKHLFEMVKSEDMFNALTRLIAQTSGLAIRGVKTGGNRPAFMFIVEQ